MTGIRKPISGLPVLGLMILGAVMLSVPREARAKSGNSFLETIGVSIAVGTVLGASTLPFYDQPGKHLANLAYGASVGAVAGVGIWIYGLLSGSSDSEISSAAGLNSFESPKGRNHYQKAPDVSGVFVPVHPALVWTPVVSLNF